MRRLAPPRGEASADSLRESLENSLRGVLAFRNTLLRSGMDQAREQYGAFAHTLLHQRGFALRKGRRDLDPQFHAIAKAARECADLLRRYHLMFAAMGELDSVDPYRRVTEVTRQKSRPGGLSEDDLRLLTLLLRHRRLSPARAAREMRKSEAMLVPCWNALRAYDLVERTGWGRGTSYRLRDDLCQALAEALLSGLAPSGEMP